MFRDLLTVLEPEMVAQRIWEEALEIHRLDHPFTYSAFHESARYTARLMREAGLQEVEIVEAPADGQSIFGDWKMPMAWDVEAATFDAVWADGRVERLADRAEIPECLAMWSGPTPPEGIEAEVVVLDDAAELAKLPDGALAGKIVFISFHPHLAKRELARAGVAGILTDFMHPTSTFPEATAWINAFSDDPGGWAFLAGDTPLWSFQISPRLGERVRARLAAGETFRGRALVRSKLYPGTLGTITGLIPGTGKEEVVLMAHQYENGADDNASGVAAAVGAARALQSLIETGKLPPPERSLRLVIVSECYSALHWWQTTRKYRPTVAALYLDAPVVKPEFATQPMEVRLNPQAQASYTDALALNLVQEVMLASPLHAWREGTFMLGDNLIADPTFNVPCPWIGQGFQAWHTSADTGDKVPAKELGLSALAAAAYAYLIATADQARALDFAHLAAMRGKQVIAAAGAAAWDPAGECDLDDAMLQVEYLTARQVEAVESVLRLVAPRERTATRAALRPLQRELRRLGKEEAAALARRAGRPGHIPAPHGGDAVLDQIHPRRLVLGPLSFDALPADVRARHASPRWSAAAFLLLFWCDGKRSLGEAARLAARELRDDHTLDPDAYARRMDPGVSSLLEYFELLRQYGYVTW